MRRGRGKGRKQSASAREEEKIPAHRRRGRPQKAMRDDFEEEDEEEEEEMVEKMEQEDEEDIDDTNERKRKISGGSNIEDIKEEENVLGSKSSKDGSTKPTSTGFRQNGSRRKSKPRRAAEAVVECNGV